MNTDWKLAPLWVAALEAPETRTYEPRDYLWASDLGKPMIDVFFKMKGEKQTNPPNGRSLRKFEAGNAWEWIVKIVLIRSDLLRTYQERVEYTYPDLLRVSGKMDFVAGGQPDIAAALENLKGLELPEKWMTSAEQVIRTLAKEHPEGLGDKPLELKSVSAFMFNALEKTEKALRIHRLQTYHQLKGSGYKRGDVVYICRDDCRMMEIPVFLDDPETEREYHDYIEQMTKFWKAGETPPLEKPVVFDMDMVKFSKNNQVAYSPYLTMLYGIEDQAQFDELYVPVAARWNRVMGRLVKDQKMTDKNLEALKEMKAAGFDPMDIAPLYKKYASDEEEEAVTE